MTLRVAARALAEFACRSGDLDFGPAGPSAREGQAAHRLVQTSTDRETEVVLERTHMARGRAITLGGRLDLLDRKRGVVGEIKTTLVPASRLPESRRALHVAQAKLYAWLWLGESTACEEVEDVAPTAPTNQQVTIEIVYVNLRGGGPEIESHQVSGAALDAFAERALDAWADWNERLDERRATLERTAAELEFPYPAFRDGQRALAVNVYRSLRDAGTLFIDAPTGTGKTASVLFPAVKALGEGRIDQVQWLTAKNSGRVTVFDALARMAAQGLEIGAVVVRAKRASCFCERGVVERDEGGGCPFSKGFYDRLPAARDSALSAGMMDGETIDRLARQHEICPRALVLQLLPWVPVVVCDYNHVFDPLVSISALHERAARRVLLIDEAHNLPSRAREMHSATLSRSECLAARSACSGAFPATARALDGLANALLALGRETMAVAATDATQSMAATWAANAKASLEPPRRIAGAAAKVLESIAETPGQAGEPPIDIDLVAAIARARATIEGWTSAHRLLIETERTGAHREVVMRLVCLDAAESLRRRHAGYRASVLSSATFQPIGFYRESLGYAEDSRIMTLASPFDAGRACRRVVDWIPVRHAERERSLPALVDLLSRTLDSRAGHYIAFLPSYSYLERVRDAFARCRPDVEIWTQMSGQSESERRRLLQRLDRGGSTLGFAILGGVFGEGVDYIGERLIGAIVIGTGLPALGVETTLAIDHHRAQGRDGFDFACRYPGLSRVLQSAGRVIRSESDRGVVLLVDSRFGEAFYRHLLPQGWLSPVLPTNAGLAAELGAFWRTERAMTAPGTHADARRIV